MSRIPPVPDTRITGLLARQRLTQQYQIDQLDLFRLQEQISTGRRLSLPSEDAPAALRAIGFQQLLSRKEQYASNIRNGLLFLGNVDQTLAGDKGVAAVLSQIKADTLGVIGTVASDEDRQAAISAINGALDSLVALGNRQFNGRYIFGGAQSHALPYSFQNGTVLYHGDDRKLKNYSDIGVLFSSNVPGQEVFGGISAAVEGTVDLNPQVNKNTLLSSLRGGRGINPNGSLQIADANTNEVSIVDISSATTLGDVARLIEASPPAGATVSVSITGTGLQIELPGGNLVISEVGTGTTAKELGLLGPNVNASTVVSEDLDPRLLRNTQLENLLGTKARAVLVSGGGDDNNDIFIESPTNGTDLDGVTISVVNGGDIGNTVGVVYDSFAKTLTISLDDDGLITAQQVINAINAEGTFRASLDHGDTSSAVAAGTGTVHFGATAVTSGGSGTTLDQNSGLRIVNGNQTHDISFAGANTVEDLLNRLNNSDANVQAEINNLGTGINVRSRASGGDFSIGEINGGTTAAQLGIRTLNGGTKLSEFNFGVGVPTNDATQSNLTQAEWTVTTSDGSSFVVDLSAAGTLGDVINAINTHVDNLGYVTAQLDADGNGIELVDQTVGVNRLFVTQDGADLGLPVGVDLTIPAIDFNITAKDGQSFAIDLSSAETVDDVLALINGAAGNAGRVTAQLASSGNGIELVDTTGGVGDLTVQRISTSTAAESLGLLGKDQESKSTSNSVLTGVDRNPLEVDSVFTSLIRLRDALAENDLPEISRAGAKLEEDISRVTFAQADVGIRFQNLDLARLNLEDEEIQIQSALSEEIDVDLVEAISAMTARQISLEASLRATANILQLSLLNFI